MATGARPEGQEKPMRGTLGRALAGALLYVAFVGSDVAAAANPVEVLGRLPSVEEVTVSPDGTRLAFIRTQGESRRLVVYSVAEKRVIAVVDAGAQKLRGLAWADANWLLLATSKTDSPFGIGGDRHELMQLRACNVAKPGCLPFDLRVRDYETLEVVFGSPVPRRVNGRTVVFVEGGFVTARMVLPALFAVDLESRTTQLVARGNEYTQGWLVDSKGGIAATLEYREKNQTYTVRVRHPDTGAWTDAASDVAATGLETPDLVGFGKDDDSVLVRFVDETGTELRAVSRRDASWSTLPAKGADGDVLIDRLTDRVIAFRDTQTSRYSFVDAANAERWQAVLQSMPDSRVQLASFADDLSQLVTLVDRPDEGLAYRFVDLKARRADLVGEVYEGLGPYADRREIHYRAADGREIPAFLTTPRNRDAKSLPLVVLPHGGPASEETADFDWWSQALATRGYAVLQPNFRGSSLSVAHLSAGFGEWGRKMQTDLSDGVRYLVRQGVADPARVCIAGASYGGYAALAGAAIDTGVYRCAVSVAGLSDLGLMLASEIAERGGRTRSRTQRWWERFMGVTGPKDPALAAISPARRADAVTIPVLLIHGKDDTVVPYEQSETMLKALRKLGKPVELVTLKNEDHWLSRGETRLQMLQESIAFLEKHNPPN
jgi:dipeptidyl aminopeptidase/acylaminoacyl peptidase